MLRLRLRLLGVRLFALIAILATSLPLEAGKAEGLESAVESIEAGDLRRHAAVLASDTFEGREAGSRGGRAAGVYLAGQLKELGVEPAGRGSFFQHFGPGYRNVLAVVPGSDPELRREYVLVGAHYDHVGYGSERNSYGPIGYIHNGADDNASGISALIELIEALAGLDARPRRSILFAFWDAEEKGLIGSEHWVEHPTVPPERIELVVNLDMIGRLRDERLEVFGVRTGRGLRRLLAEQNRATDLTLDFNWNVERNSDHYPFFERRTPFLMFHTGKHRNYHRPSDDLETLNLRGMQRVSRLLFRTVFAAADRPALPAFRPASRHEDEEMHRERLAARESGPRRLGVGWDGEADQDDDVRLTRVNAGSPAERAGLQTGDRVLRFGGYRPRRDNFAAIVLASESPAKVVIDREGVAEPLELTVRLRGDRHPAGIEWRYDRAEPGAVALTGVSAGSPAYRAGLRATHRIYAVSGRRFEDGREFRELLGGLESPAKLLVEARGRLRTVTLRPLPAPMVAQTAAEGEMGAEGTPRIPSE